MNNPDIRTSTTSPAGEAFQLLYFSQLLGRRIRHDGTRRKNGRLTDLVFRLSEPYPEPIGIYIEHGHGLPTELVPWDRVQRIEDEAVFIAPDSTGKPYPPFSDQKGWILLNEHLMGQTILDIDGRRTEVVNDVHLLFSKGRMILVHVDISFNGFLRKWHLDRLFPGKDQLISWRYVQPLSVEDHKKDVVTLSVAREQALALPGEDLADALEVLSGDEQQAMFGALDPEKAAEVLVEAEPRAKRQLMAFLGGEKARLVLARMTVPQIADLFSNLPHDKVISLTLLLPTPRAARVNAVMTNSEVLASALMSDRFLGFDPATTAGMAISSLRASPCDRRNLSYLYVVSGTDRTLVGSVDLRDLVLAAPETKLSDIMVSPVVTADRDLLKEDLAEMFAKYRFRMLPVVDAHDHLMGVVRYKDIMKDARIELPS